jgi:hypothetical protein
MFRAMSMHSLPEIWTSVRIHCIIHKRSATLSHRGRICHGINPKCYVITTKTEFDTGRCLQGLHSAHIPIPAYLLNSQHRPIHLWSDGGPECTYSKRDARPSVAELS